jgi:hypothetical protein
MNRHTRVRILGAAASAALAVSLLAFPGGAAAGVEGAEPDTVSTLTNIYNNPNANYLSGATCLINLSSIADFTLVPSITQCGHTVTFAAPPEKRSIPASWPTPWGGAGQTEIPNPDVLYTLGANVLQIRFSTPRRVAGVEASPQLGAAQSFKADYIDVNGNLIGTVSRNITGGKARLLGAKTQASTKVAMIQITSNGDFAIARVRFKP